jgi:hypothetical protein
VAEKRAVNGETKLDDEEMLEEYDFSGGVRGKYVGRLKNSKQVVLLEPDVAEVFPDSESVNKILHELVPIINAQAEKVQHS